MSKHYRLLAALGIGMLTALYMLLAFPTIHGRLVDVPWSFNAAWDLLAGRDPYRYPPGVHMIPYPLTAAVIVLPWALLPKSLGLAALFGVSSGMLAYGVLRNNEYWRLLLFLSPAYVAAVQFSQWSLLFMVVFYYPALCWLLLAKPTLALPVALSIRWTWRRIGLCFALGLVSLLLMPNWPLRWLSQVQSYAGFIPALTLLGLPMVAACVFFWRNQAARFFIFMAITPQHRYLYDQLLLWMLPKTLAQGLIMVVGGWLSFMVLALLFQNANFTPESARSVSSWYIMGGAYLPAFLVVCIQQGVFQHLRARLFQRRSLANYRNEQNA